MQTTLIRTRREIETQPLENCHEGQGTLQWSNILDEAQIRGRRLRFLYRNVMPPGVSIGIHPHAEDEEYYYILSGRGVMTLDAKEYEVGPGDITVAFPGGKHGLRNTGDEDLDILVISVGSAPPDAKQ